MKAIAFEEKDEDFEWFDQTMIDAIKHGEKNVLDFFTLLALCHTVMTEEKDGKIIYQAQSPDENALVSASRSFGFAFAVRRNIEIHDQYFIDECFLNFHRVAHKVVSPFVFKAEKKPMNY